MTPEIQALLADLEREGYVAEPHIATAAHLARAMRKPLLVEGDAGVGKTELAKVLARLYGTELIRLQCYEGLDVQTALYEWDYPRQLLRIRMSEAQAAGAQAAGPQALDPQALEARIFSRDCLLERPLLRAITRGRPPVLLIDEIDRADDGFEAFLLELLSDFQVTIPELGTIQATHPPHVVLTSNRTRELGDALRRRCLYLYIEHPDLEKEVRIIRARRPDARERLAREVARFLQALRGRDLVKPPGVAETLDWTQALVSLRQDALSEDVVAQTLGCLLKDRADLQTVTAADVTALVAQAREVS
jgi:MoxR-like ATPase